LGVLPNLLPDAYLGILIATVLTAVGGGLIEVVVSPMIEAMPTQNKGRQMAILHSFYCWGECAVVLFSTLFFALAGIDAWFILPFAWAIVPFSNIFLLCGIPLYELPKEAKDGSTVVGMLKSPLFWVMAAMMVASGASELCMCTWASIFAEVGLGVDKSVGDLLGPFLFALLMGIGRVVSAKLTTRVPVEKCLFVSALGCTACYFSTVFFGSAIISLLSCAASGFFVALMWPGTYSLGASRISCGGTKMFALFALGGDIGCSLGSYVTGRVSDLVNSGKWSFFTSFLPAAGTGIRAGILVSSLFPVLMIIGSLLVMRTGKKRQRMSE
ncbi:MAG: MFS transporter, partial [Clostridia bacterium]|nr:MFS transporter [Clostridia bacterium]